MFFVGVDIEMFSSPGGEIGYCLSRQVDFYLCRMVGGYCGEELGEEIIAYGDREHEAVELVLLMYVGKEA